MFVRLGILLLLLASLSHSSVLLVEARWNATGNLRTIWATPVMEYRNLFDPNQVEKFADEVRKKFDDFLTERADPNRRRKLKPPAEHSSTPSDKDRINEEFYNYQGRHPLSDATLLTIWQAFTFAVSKYIDEASMPPINYQKPNAAQTALEWTDTRKSGPPALGRQYCWGSVQSGGVHHDLHTHPGSSVAGTLYLNVPRDAGALTLSDPRGPMPPFQYAYRVSPEVGMFVLFPGTVPHGVHGTPGDEPRVSVSCNYPGDWTMFTTNKVIWSETTWSHEMMSREEHMAAEAESKTKEGGQRKNEL